MTRRDGADPAGGHNPDSRGRFAPRKQPVVDVADIRIAVDEDCPQCGWPELSGALPDGPGPLLLCRGCGWHSDRRADVEFVDDGLGDEFEAELDQWEAGRD